MLPYSPLTTALMHIRTIRLSKSSGGRCGIRTHGPVSRASVFETDTIDRSVNLPFWRREWDSNPCPSSSPRFRLANGLLKPLEHLSKFSWRIGWDSNPRTSFPISRLPTGCHSPLDHLSKLRRAWDSNPRASYPTFWVQTRRLRPLSQPSDCDAQRGASHAHSCA